MSIDQIVKDAIHDEVETQAKDIEVRLQDSVHSSVLQELSIIRPIVVKTATEERKVSGLNHEKTEELLTYITARVPILLVGPAGSGKTHTAVACSEALGLPHYSISVNEQTSKSDFLGYTDAHGEIVKTNFRTAYENGGVFIIDEIDAGNPNILTVINSALSNDFCPFPGGMVKRHDDFVCICTANTFGEGESMQYIGRNILDAATRDRFSCVFIGYSQGIEKIRLPTYYQLIQDLRAYFERTGAHVVVSTRGGLRLETLRVAKEAPLTEDDIIACLNLHSLVAKDTEIKKIIQKFLGGKKEEKKTKKPKLPPDFGVTSNGTPIPNPYLGSVEEQHKAEKERMMKMLGGMMDTDVPF